MKPALWTESYRVSSFLVNLRRKLGLYAALNLIQDVGWQHAGAAGVDLPSHLAWVFTRQKLVMRRWPKWNETVEIRTWIRPPEATPFVYRDYELLVDGQKVGECTSTFTVIDKNTRKVSSPDWQGIGLVFRAEGNLGIFPEKIPLESDLEELASFEVRNSDIDLNDHVNNTKYAQWVLDAIPLSVLRDGARLLEFEVNFLAECKMGDVITVALARVADPGIVQFQGIRKKDGKTVFAVRMTVKEEK